MTMPALGARIAFSDLQTVFNGEHPISIDEYYQDASTGYTSGVTGIPNINSGIPDIKSPISLYMFYDKSKIVSPPPPAVNYMLSGNGVASMATGTTFVSSQSDDNYYNIGNVSFPFFWFGTDWGSSNNIQWTTNNVLTFGGGNAQYNQWTATTGKGVLIGQRDRMTNFANEFAPLINHNNTNHSIKRFNANQTDYYNPAVRIELDIRLIRGPEYQYIEIRLGNLVNVNLENAGLWNLSDGGTFYNPFSLNAEGRPINSNQSLVLRGDLTGYNWVCFPQHYMNLGI